MRMFAAALLALAIASTVFAQATIDGAQPAPGQVAIGKGIAFVRNRTAVINSLGRIDGATGTLSDCVRVDGTSGPCGTGVGLLSQGAGFAVSRAAVINSIGSVDGAAGTVSDCLRVDGASAGACIVKGAAFGVSGVATINSLGKIDKVAGSPSDCVFVDGSSGACNTGGSAPNFSDDEAPAQVDALNYTLAHTPSPASSLQVFVNGIRTLRGVDYTITGSPARTVSFISFYTDLLSAPLANGTTVIATYRY